MISKWLRCSDVASDRRHDQAKGTLMVRPSANSAVIESSVTCMPMMRGVSLTTMLIPSLQDPLSVFRNQLANTIQLGGRKSLVETEHDRLQPELADHSLTPNVHMLRLVAVETIEEEPIRPRNIANRRHYAFPSGPDSILVYSKTCRNGDQDAIRWKPLSHPW
jgi:hypothetical protein